MKTEIKKPNISGIFPVLSFAVLAACIVIVLVTGARLYGRSNQQDSVDYYRRTVTGYITTRFMQSNVEGRFFVGDFHEALPRSSGNTLFFTETIGGKEYVTRVYCHEGNVYELFSPLEANIAPEYGEKVLPVNNIDFSVNNGLFLAHVTFNDGENTVIRLSLRAGGAESEK